MLNNSNQSNVNVIVLHVVHGFAIIPTIVSDLITPAVYQGRYDKS